MNNFENIDNFLRHKVSQAQFEQKDWHWEAAQKLLDAQERKRRLGWVILSVALPLLLALPLFTGNGFAHQRTPQALYRNYIKTTTPARQHATNPLRAAMQNTAPQVAQNEKTGITPIFAMNNNVNTPQNINKIINTIDADTNIQPINTIQNTAPISTDANQNGAKTKEIIQEIAQKITPKTPILPTPKVHSFVHNIYVEAGTNHWRRLPASTETDPKNNQHTAPHVAIGYAASLKKWSLASGIGYTTQSLHVPTRTITQNNYNFGLLQTTYQIKNKTQHIIQVPVMIGYQIAIKHQIMAGINMQKTIVGRYEVATSELNSIVGIPRQTATDDLIIKENEAIQTIAIVRYKLQCANRLGAYIEYQKPLQHNTHAAGLGVQFIIKK